MISERERLTKTSWTSCCSSSRTILQWRLDTLSPKQLILIFVNFRSFPWRMVFPFSARSINRKGRKIQNKMRKEKKGSIVDKSVKNPETRRMPLEHKQFYEKGSRKTVFFFFKLFYFSRTLTSTMVFVIPPRFQAGDSTQSRVSTRWRATVVSSIVSGLYYRYRTWILLPDDDFLLFIDAPTSDETGAQS